MHFYLYDTCVPTDVFVTKLSIHESINKIG